MTFVDLCCQSDDFSILETQQLLQFLDFGLENVDSFSQVLRGAANQVGMTEQDGKGAT